jgi:hypothetical protein
MGKSMTCKSQSAAMQVGICKYYAMSDNSDSKYGKSWDDATAANYTNQFNA